MNLEQPFASSVAAKDGRILGVGNLIVLKSDSHFRAWWADVASEIIDCDPLGVASNDLMTFTFQKKTRKVYP